MKRAMPCGLAFAGLLISALCHAEEANHDHDISRYLAAIDSLGATHFRIGYLYHDLEKGQSADATLEAWEDGDRYRYEVDGSALSDLGQMGTVKYSYDGQLAMMKWPGTTQLVVARQPHAHLPLPVPHPLALLTDFVLEEPTLYSRFRSDEVLEGWRDLADDESRGLAVDNPVIEARSLNGVRFEVSLSRVDRWVVPSNVEKNLSNGQRLVVSATDWTRPSTLDGIPVPRQLDLDVWDEEGNSIGRGVLRILEIRRLTAPNASVFQLDTSAETEIWVDEEQQLSKDVQGTLQRLRTD
ncbi:MAG: hypothetical protein AAGC60_28555 [Acidobacteriota bacterium]